MAVERDVTLPDVDLELAWQLVTRDEDLQAWLGAEVELDPVAGGSGRVVEEDGTTRELSVEVAEPGERLRWRWWPLDSSDGPASTVEITLHPDDGGTRVRVLEIPTPAATSLRASASLGSGWPSRLLSLELLGVRTSALVRV